VNFKRTVHSMRYTTLGHSGTIVSTQTLGTMTFGQEADEADSGAIIEAFVERGGTLIDTADVYSSGVSEEILGRWLASHPRDAAQLVIATKGRFPMGEGANDVGLSRRHLRIALEASLRRLGVEHIDLYQMHAWDAATPIEETLRFLDDAVTAGKISYYGFSNYLGWQVTKAAETARAHGWSPPVTLQPQYNLLVRDIEHEVVPACLDAGLGLLPWSPLAGGWLQRKVSTRRRPHRPLAPRRRPRARDGGVAAPKRPVTHVGHHRRGRRRGRGAADHLSAGVTCLAGLSAGGHLRDHWRPNSRAAPREHGGRRPRPRARATSPARQGERTACGRLPLRPGRHRAAPPRDPRTEVGPRHVTQALETSPPGRVRAVLGKEFIRSCDT